MNQIITPNEQAQMSNYLQIDRYHYVGIRDNDMVIHQYDHIQYDNPMINNHNNRNIDTIGPNQIDNFIFTYRTLVGPNKLNYVKETNHIPHDNIYGGLVYLGELKINEYYTLQLVRLDNQTMILLEKKPIPYSYCTMCDGKCQSIKYCRGRIQTLYSEYCQYLIENINTDNIEEYNEIFINKYLYFCENINKINIDDVYNEF